MQVLRTVCRAGALFLLATLPLSPARAGQEYGMTFSCAPSGGERVCSGNLRAARTSPGATDQVEFRVDGTGYLYFIASYAGVRYQCTFDLPSSANLAPAALAADFDTYFAIRMNAQGNCLSNSYLTNNSAYKKL